MVQKRIKIVQIYDRLVDKEANLGLESKMFRLGFDAPLSDAREEAKEHNETTIHKYDLLIGNVRRFIGAYRRLGKQILDNDAKKLIMNKLVQNEERLTYLIRKKNEYFGNVIDYSI